MSNLFLIESQPEQSALIHTNNQKELGQYFTPTWAAEALVKRSFADLNAHDVVMDPSCGDGRFLLAIPDGVDGFGVELDPHWAAEARKNTGREVVTGDFTQVALPRRPTAIVGNPPYNASLIDAFLSRCYEELEYEGRVGFILPVYYFQTAGKVVELSKKFSISQELLPRNLFDGLTCPIAWAMFTKARRTFLSGFFLHEELQALNGMHKEIRKVMVGNESKALCWREAVEAALNACGGRATLQELYRVIEGNRPSNNPWWREKVRQIAGKYFHRVQAGEYALPMAA